MSKWSGSSGQSTRRAIPAVFGVVSVVFVGLLVACSVTLVLAQLLPGVGALRVAVAGFSGMYGLVGAVLGGLLAANHRGSASGMSKLSRTLSAKIPFLRPWSTGRYRVLGGSFIVVGVVMTAIAWSGSINWKQ